MLKYSAISAAVFLLLTVPAMLQVTDCFSDLQLGLYFTVLALVAIFLLPSVLYYSAQILLSLKMPQLVLTPLSLSQSLLRFADRLSFYSTVTASAITHCTIMLISAYRQLDKQRTASEVGSQALAYLEMSQGMEWPGLSTLISELAILDLQASNTARARSQLRRARKLAERAYAEDDDKHGFDLLLDSMERLAIVETNLKHYTEAISEYNKCIDIRENKLGPVHWSVGIELCRLAQVYMRVSDYREATLKLARAQMILENCTGATELQIALDISQAEAEQGAGNLSEAKRLALKAFALSEKHFGADDPRHSEVIDTLGKIHRDLAEYDEAETFFRQNMEATKKLATTNSLEFSRCLRSYADLLRLMNRNREADNLEHRAEQINYKIRSV